MIPQHTQQPTTTTTTTTTTTWWATLLVRSGVLVIVFALVVWYSQPYYGMLRVYFLDVAGDAILIQTPQGGFTLVDGGSDPVALTLALGNILPFWQRSLDAMILTHTDAARLPGQVAVLARYHVSLVLAPAPADPATTDDHAANETTTTSNPLYDEWVRLLLEDNQSSVRVAHAGDMVPLGNDALLLVLTPSNADSAMTLLVAYGTTRILIVPTCPLVDEVTDDNHDALHDVLLMVPPPVAALAYPWVCDMPQTLMQAWQPQTIVFRTGCESKRPALLSFADRRWLARGGNNTMQATPLPLFHPELHGLVTLTCDATTHCAVEQAH